MKGFGGTTLRIDLTKGEIRKEPLDERLAREYLGGRGFVARILWDELPAGADPLSAENLLIVANGVLNGHPGPAGNRVVFGCKSPLTGGYGDSMMGGYFAPELKKAGYDLIIFKGRSEKPTYLHICDDTVELTDAAAYWGRGAIETERELKRRHGEKYQVAAIGPAAENLVKFACVTHHTGRNAGRTGAGTMMGHKRLKAIAVRGTKKLEIHDEQRLMELQRQASRDMVTAAFFEQFKKYGTNNVLGFCNEIGALPNRNFQYGTYEHWDDVSGEAQRTKTFVRDMTCWSCPLACYMEIEMKRYGGIKTHYSEYETTAMIATNLELKDVEDLQYANYLCNDLGLDTITTGSVIAFAIECYEKRIITDRETGGLRLEWGNPELVHELIRMIATRKGIGNILAEGTRYLAQLWNKGSMDFAIQVKGMEASAYDSRAAPAMALSFMTCDVGAHHNRSWAITRDTAMGREKIEGKAEVVVDLQHRRPLLDQLGVCRFPWVEVDMNYDYYAKFYNAITGDPKSTEDLLRISERVWNLTRCFWIREKPDFGRKDDLPPKRWMTPFKVENDPAKGQHLTERDVNRLLERYYELRGWDSNGRPTRRKLEELGLSDVAEKLAGMGRIS